MIRVSAIFLLVLPLTACAQATVSLKAIARNGIPVTPTSSLAVFPNDVVTAEIYITSWGNPPFDGFTGLLRAYQVTLAGKASALSSGYCPGTDGSRLILPYGWDAPIEKDECPCENPRYPICDPQFGCIGPNHHPEWMAAIEDKQFGRVDSVFYPHPSLCEVNTSSLDIRWRCSLLDSGGQGAAKCLGGPNHGLSCTTSSNCPAGTCSSAFPHYAGTLYLKVGAPACGTFTYTFQADPSLTFLTNAQPFSISTLPAIQPLTLFIPQACSNPAGACCTNNAQLASCEVVCKEDCTQPNQRFGGIGSSCESLHPPCDIVNAPESSSPADCLIDARIPNVPGQASQRLGFAQMTLTFPNPIGPNEDAPADFGVSQIPLASPPPPTIASVTPGPGNTVTLAFSDPIRPNNWTCVRHLASNSIKCLGFLPGDVNGNRSALPNDILDIIDNLNRVRIPPLAIHQCDIDRSGVCAPADILTEIDLLNGSGIFPFQNGLGLPPCPSAMAP